MESIDWEDVPVFGDRAAGVVYTIRPSAYGVLQDERGRVATVRAPEGVFLPGGGMEANESIAETVTREFREECAFRVEPGAWRVHAVQLVRSEKYGEAFQKRSTFVDVRFAGMHDARPEADHVLVWAQPEAALEALSQESHRFAVREWRARGRADRVHP